MDDVERLPARATRLRRETRPSARIGSPCSTACDASAAIRVERDTKQVAARRSEMLRRAPGRSCGRIARSRRENPVRSAGRSASTESSHHDAARCASRCSSPCRARNRARVETAYAEINTRRARCRLCDLRCRKSSCGIGQDCGHAAVLAHFGRSRGNTRDRTQARFEQRGHREVRHELQIMLRRNVMDRSLVKRPAQFLPALIQPREERLSFALGLECFPGQFFFTTPARCDAAFEPDGFLLHQSSTRDRRGCAVDTVFQQIFILHRDAMAGARRCGPRGRSPRPARTPGDIRRRR